MASSISEGTLTLTSVEKVPAGTGLLLKGEAGKHFTVHTTGSAAAVGNNLLVGLTEETDVSQTTADGIASSLNGGEWYDLNGRKLIKKPTRKGLYIFNGRKTLIVYGRCKKGGGMHAVIPKSFVPLHP